MFVIFDWIKQSLEKALVDTDWRLNCYDFSKQRITLSHTNTSYLMVLKVEFTSQHIFIHGKYSSLDQTFLTKYSVNIPYSAKSFETPNFLVPRIKQFISDLVANVRKEETE